jgi:hypothetical protein
MLSRVFSGLLALILICSAAQAAPEAHPAASLSAPTTPSAPPALFQKPAPESFRCERFFTYEGKTYGCDSVVRPDGEGLRPFLQDVPAANAKLNAYQETRHNLRNTAYVGSLGLAVLIAGLVAGTGNGKKAMIIGGTSIFGGSLVYGFAAAKANETNLGEAVRLHNLAKPDKPIELQFSTGIGF